MEALHYAVARSETWFTERSSRCVLERSLYRLTGDGQVMARYDASSGGSNGVKLIAQLTDLDPTRVLSLL